MTNSYNLSHQKIKILIIHGLNNSISAFQPIRDELSALGHECELITLPGHNQDRNEASHFEIACEVFNRTIEEKISSPYAVVAFSQGALYLQLWLEKTQRVKPVAQILLSPALYIRRQKILETIIGLLPSGLQIPSKTPKRFRLYPTLFVRDYHILFKAINTYQSIQTSLPTKTLILIDPRDELVNAERLKTKTEARDTSVQFIFFERPHLKNKFGAHHIMFDPNYFQNNDWEYLINKINSFLSD